MPGRGELDGAMASLLIGLARTLQIAFLIEFRQIAQTLLHLLPSGHSFSRGLLGSLGNIVAGGLALRSAVTHIQMRTMLGSISLTMATRSPAGAVSFRERSEDGDRGQTFDLAQQLASLGSTLNRPSHGPPDALESEQWKTGSW